MQLPISPEMSLNGSPVERANTAFTSNAVKRRPAEESVLPLRLSGVSYSVRGKTLLMDISMTIAPDGNTIVLGPNGAGKSLLLRLCHGLLIPTTGSIAWLGPGAVHVARRRQAMVFQRPVLLRRTVAANIEYALKLGGVHGREQHERTRRALEMTGLTGFANCHARVLSGGEQQRIALARAWALQPEVLFLDEPTANLDPAATRVVEEVIRVFRDAGTKIVMTTHDLGQARRLADEVLFLHGGRLLEHSSAKEFFRQPHTEEAAAYLRGDLLW